MTVLGLAFGQRQVVHEKIASGRQPHQGRVGGLHVAAEHHRGAVMVDPIRYAMEGIIPCGTDTEATRRSP